MSADHAPNPAVRATQLAPLAAVLAMVVGAIVLIGWAFDIAVLKSILPGWFPMKANAAVCHILTGVALLLIARPPATSNPQRAVFSSRFCVLLVGLVGLLTLCEYIFGWNPGIDQWLFREPAGAVGTPHPGRMAQEAALNFVLLSVALWISSSSRKTRWTVLAPVSLGLLVTTLALAALLSYLTPGLGAYGWFGLSIMALHAAMLFAMLGMAVIAISWQPDVLPWSLGRRATAMFACGMVVLVFIGFNASRSQFWMKEMGNRITATEIVQGDIESILVEVIDAQAHTRGYVITGEERYLKSYLLSKAVSGTKLDELRRVEFFSADPIRQQHFARIEALVNAQLQWHQKVIDASRSGMTGAAINNMVAHGEDLLDNLRTEFEQIQSVNRQFGQRLKLELENVSRLSLYDRI